MGKRIDLIGKRFGKLVVVSYSRTQKEKCGATRAIWNCQCDCGNTIEVKAGLLANGKVKSCGCLKHERSYKFEDLSGNRFGRLVVLELEKPINRRTMWKCRCDCGNIVTVDAYSIKSGHTKSCGCLHREVAKETITKHGLSHSKVRRTWKNMISRCENKKCSQYGDYGGRGITVCEEWHDLEIFAKWAYANGFSEEKTKSEQTIERKDVNGNYEPSNCCFVTMKEQNNNKRNSRRISCNGETHTLSEWSEITGINRTTIAWRLNKGLSAEEALEMR